MVVNCFAIYGFSSLPHLMLTLGTPFLQLYLASNPCHFLFSTPPTTPQFPLESSNNMTEVLNWQREILLCFFCNNQHVRNTVLCEPLRYQVGRL
jgi:hypothetical protein